MENTFGIHDIAFKAPSLYLPIEDLAEARNIQSDKLKYGLGLLNMSVCDADEDIISLATGAVLNLLQQNPEIKPKDIGRIYVGTESSIDGSKPIGTYVHQLVSQYFENKGIESKALMHTDVVDMTFACIGAVDAMHNSLDWLRTEPDKVAIVVAADIANYDLDSSGEYTQGAGAVAVLLRKNPDLLSIDAKWGVAMKSEHDFFKPIRFEIRENKVVELHDEKPVFDGQFSNQTYQNRISEAWQHFGKENLLDFKSIVFHLPYAFHGRRIVTPLVLESLRKNGKLNAIIKEFELDENAPDFVKTFSKTTWYKNFVKQIVEPGEVLSSDMGNLYTASIFLSLMSSLINQTYSVDDEILFFAYGSGSKAKVFSGKLQRNFAKIIDKWDVSKEFNNREKIDFQTYLSIRNKTAHRAFGNNKIAIQTASGISEVNRFARTYALTNDQ